MSKIQPKTVTDAVYEQIKSDIIAGVYRPGQRLMETELAQKLQVSRTPVRDAMIRLEQEGLTTIRPHRGIYVRKLSKKDIQDYYQLRAVLEGLGAKLAAVNGTEEDHQELKNMLIKMREILDAYQHSQDFKEMALCNNQFHELIFKIGGNQVLAQTQATLANPIALVRSISWFNTKRIAEVWLEHKNIVEAIVARDAELAQKRAEEHIYQAWKSAESKLDQLEDEGEK
ncbi:DNA-binding GntR family transcriptional regulator [Caldalkalibacillus uzonensis]|uniref:DNA-binding GntR family transcriptional regulator n=1 Tax=Caldalkalibacillus uzonensis TaxID=353224 RepID=A0ABU0CNX0_9BACI|nr:GntR family transcriptional regulator [Caldalkalibacillus uzonensis]MDQ0338099.1 DNA-binding GntR family transcriptional regulator [Caldalkalibacillus uzonensis]